MATYTARLDRIQEVLGSNKALSVFVWDGQDQESAIAGARAAHNWPDDDAHPARLTVFRWQEAA